MTEDRSMIAVKRYVNNLDTEALRFLAVQLILYPESRKFMVSCINEFNKFYRFPIGDKKDAR